MQNTYYEPHHVYTFHIRQHIVDVVNFKLMLPILKYDLVHHLNGQPLRFMAVHEPSGQHYWNFEVCHRLSHAPCHAHLAVTL